MRLNNKGFALTSIIYMLIVLFLMIMLLILANLASRKVVLDKIKNEVKENLNQGGLLAQNKYIVTFDPNGGQLSQTTKEVTYNEPYGDLPTPTKEGYDFTGWRGKNMLNMKEWLDSFDAAYRGNITKGENSITLTATSDDAYTASYKEENHYRIIVEPNTTYTLSWESNNNNSGRVFVFVNDLQTTGYMFLENNTTTKEITFTTPADAKYITFRVGVNSSGNSITYSNFQLEVGETATDYEPYQEYKKDTIETKQENHTMYAHWNSIYNIVYNGNGETSGSTESSLHIYNKDKSLTSNGFEKTGYYFTGWSTNQNDVNIIYDDNEYSYDYTSGVSGAYVNFAEYVINGPFQEGEIYQLDVDIKGTGSLNNYFYGASGYLQVSSMSGLTYIPPRGDGLNKINLTDNYTHYWIKFTLGSNGDGSVDKKLLFRVYGGNSVSIKNIRFYKVSSTSRAFTNEQVIKRLSTTPGDTINLYAIWKANE